MLRCGPNCFEYVNFNIIFNGPSLPDCHNLQSSAAFVTRNILKATAESRNSEELILVYKSSIKVLSNRGPKVEPYGTNTEWETYLVTD
jgi:hypothetical protein